MKEQYWLIYRVFGNSGRETKPFISKESAVNWALQNNYEILGIAEPYEVNIEERITFYIEKIRNVLDEDFCKSQIIKKYLRFIENIVEKNLKDKNDRKGEENAG